MRSRFWLAFAFLVALALGFYIFRKETTPRQQIHYRRGLDYALVGKYDDAIRELNRSLKYEPDYAPAYNNLGIIYYRLGRKKDAMLALEKAARLDPAFPEARYNLGKIYAELSAEERALAQFKEALRLNPDYTKAREAIAGIYFGFAREKHGRGEYGQAEYNVSRAYDHSPERADIIDLWAKTELVLGRYDKAIELFEKASSKDPNLDVVAGVSEALQKKGELLYKKSEFADAEKYLTQALKKDQENGRANYFLGMVYSRRGETKKAVGLLRKGLKLDERIAPETGQAEYHMSIASGLKRSKNYNRAIQEYQLAAAIDPAIDIRKNLAESYYWLGRDQYERGLVERAVGYLERARELEPADIGYRLALARALEASKKPVRAAVEYRSVLKVEPDSAEIRFALAKVLIAAGLYDEAISELELTRRMNAGFSLDKELIETYYGRGRTREQRGELEKAQRDYARVVEIDPQYKDARIRIGVCFEKMGDLQQAMKVYEKNLNDEKIGWQSHYHLGVCLMKSGDKDAALEYAKRHVDKGRGFHGYDRFAEAVKEYRMAIDIAPDWYVPYQLIAKTHWDKSKFKMALPWLEKSIELAPDSAILANDLGVIYAKLGRYKEAETMFHQAIKLKSPYHRACINLSYLYGLMKMDKESLWWAKQASQIRKGFPVKQESGFWLR